MVRLTVFLLALIIVACNSKNSTGEDTGYTYENFAQSFKTASLPFQLTDTFLLRNKDTAAIRDANFSSLIPDSISHKVFGKGVRIKYIPLWKLETPDGDSYYIIKTESKNKKAAFLVIFDKDAQLNASFPFLIPDDQVSTTQVSSMDKAFTISKAVVRREPNNVNAEGKDVYAYDRATKTFVLVMTDALDERSLELINPIDTLAKSHKLAGDYTKEKQNIVSVRDGKRSNLLTVFIHIEKGDCIGELKGDATITSPTTAVYQQAGDPCVLQLNFKGSSVKLTELAACGSRRGLDCRFEGSFTRKKATGLNTTQSKSKRSKK